MGLMSMFSGIFRSKKPQSSLTGAMTAEGFVSKELFYEILDLDSSIMLFFTKKDGWIGANRAFFATFDFTDIDDFRNRHESLRELFESEAEEVFTEYDKSWLDYIRVHKKEGYLVTILNRDGEPCSYRAKCRMIKQQGTDLYALDLEDISELENAQRQTVAVEKLKSKFLANIGHEFRTPMNGILGFIELLEKSDPTERQGEYLNMIHSSARNLMSNIESLLDLAQMQGGRLKVSNSEFHLVNEMEEVARIFFGQGKDKGINISFLIDPKLPTYITGDLRKIKQVLNNLVNNAIKFTARGGRVVVEVKLLKRQLSGQCSVGFAVKDTGKGIAADQLALITEPFVSGDQADNRLGVGLSLSHGLIKLMDGDLKIQSVEGRGSSFNFALNFDASKESAMRMLTKRTVKVALLDENKIEEANALTNYLRSFGVNVVKVHMIDEQIYNDTELLYIVASQEQSAWMLKLGTFNKKCKTVLLLDAGEKLQTRTSHIIDYTVSKPLLPSSMEKHLSHVFKIPKEKSKISDLHKDALRALVAEDNLINQRLIKILLQEYGLRVTTASDGEQAVKLCRDHAFDIIFMDIDMPVKDGIRATQEIKNEEQVKGVKMPIIALTALAMEGDREHILEEGLDDYLSKPLTREKLEYVLNKHLQVTVGS